ncbi:hypothetical protein THIX_10125 [Thiomonas sp. X19]|nr:hypothetical protein THIX_10125 [Thiomonas sp. X19]
MPGSKPGRPEPTNTRSSLATAAVLRADSIETELKLPHIASIPAPFQHADPRRIICPIDIAKPRQRAGCCQ